MKIYLDNPALSSISPTNRSIAAGNFTLTVTGTDFLPTSVIVFDGVALATTFVNAGTLTASVTVAGATAGSKNVFVRTFGNADTGIKIFTYSA